MSLALVCLGVFCALGFADIIQAMGRILLMLIVAVNLTVVCQGHDVQGRHFDLHLMVLGELPASVETVVLDGHAGGVPAEQHGTDATQQVVSEVASATTQANILAVASSGPLVKSQGELGFSMLSFLLVAAQGLTLAHHRARLRRANSRLCSQTAPGPDPPPPRRSF